MGDDGQRNEGEGSLRVFFMLILFFSSPLCHFSSLLMPRCSPATLEAADVAHGEALPGARPGPLRRAGARPYPSRCATPPDLPRMRDAEPVRMQPRQSPRLRPQWPPARLPSPRRASVVGPAPPAASPAPAGYSALNAQESPCHPPSSSLPPVFPARRYLARDTSAGRTESSARARIPSSAELPRPTPA